MGLWIFLAVVVLLLVYAVAVYNRLVRLRALVHEGFSGITVQLRRRADLVPNLVETVKGYATHERETLDQVTAHRTDAMNAGSVAATAQADNAMTAMLGRLFAVAEAYPELKADANFRDLQTQLSTIEEDVQSARRYYNGAARNQNTLIESFPSNLVANHFRFEQVPYFEIGDEAARAVPKVDFGPK